MDIKKTQRLLMERKKIKIWCEADRYTNTGWLEKAQFKTTTQVNIINLQNAV